MGALFIAGLMFFIPMIHMPVVVPHSPYTRQIMCAEDGLGSVSYALIGVGGITWSPGQYEFNNYAFSTARCP